MHPEQHDLDPALEADPNAMPTEAPQADTLTPEAEAPEVQGSQVEAGAPADAPEHTPEQLIESLSAELKRTRDELAAERDALLRLQADFSNFRRRKEKEVGDAIAFGNQDLLKAMLPLVDDLERTLSAAEKTENLAAVKEGVGLVAKNFHRFLQKVGVEPIASKGQPFSAETHEAITAIPAPDEAQRGLVFDEIETGYLYKGKVLRFAKVVVAE